MKVPTWGVYMMFIASGIGTVLLGMDLNSRHWPQPFQK